MGLVDYVINEWNRNNNSTALKIALVKEKRNGKTLQNIICGIRPFRLQ